MMFGKTVDELQGAGWEALHLDEYRDALAAAHHLRRRRHSSAFEIAALAYLGLDEKECALTVLEEGVGVVPGNFRLRHLLGSLLSDAGRYEEALASYDIALQCPGSNDAAVALNRAIVLDRQEKFSEALELVTEYVGADDPKVRGGLRALRMDLLNTLGRHTEVLDLFDEAISESEASQGDEAEAEIVTPGDSIDGGPVFTGADPSMARLWVEKCRAEKALGADDEILLNYAINAMEADASNTAAQWWLREMRGEYSPSARMLKIMIVGAIADNSADNGYGYFRPFSVMADDLEDALTYIREIEEEDFTVEEWCISDEAFDPDTNPKGVYSVGDYCLFPPDDEAAE